MIIVNRTTWAYVRLLVVVTVCCMAMACGNETKEHGEPREKEQGTSMPKHVQKHRTAVLVMAPGEVRKVSFGAMEAIELDIYLTFERADGMVVVKQVNSVSSIRGSWVVPYVSRSFLPKNGWLDLEVKNNTKAWVEVKLIVK